MKTEDFINALVEDQGLDPSSLVLKFVAWIVLGLSVSLMILFFILRVREDFKDVMTDPHIVFKFVFAASLCASLVPMAISAFRPETPLETLSYWLVLPLLVLAGGVVFQLMTTQQDSWVSGMIGHYPMACLGSIPVLAIGPFAAIFMILRHGAPTQPVKSGAVAGAISASIAAFIFALHCPNDSALFVAVWYSLAITIMTILGAVVGTKWLRW